LNQKFINQLFENFNNLTALIIGDVMIDVYLWGNVNRISPEAPVPIINISEREYRLGGAANVALNVSSLGATPIICTVVGEDNSAEKLEELLTSNKLSNIGLVKSDIRKTTVKTRIISQNQHMLRVDDEDSFFLTNTEEILLFEKIADIIEKNNVDVIIFEDYNKGVLTESIIKKIITLANQKNIPTTVDPKKENFFSYKNVSLFKPNLKELREGLKIEIPKNNKEALQNAVIQLKAKIQHSIALITLSEHGVFVESENNFTIIPAHKRKLIDVSGAGDTVISVASLLLAQNVKPEIMASIANLSGGLVCEEVGVVPINKSILLKETLSLFS